MVSSAYYSDSTVHINYKFIIYKQNTSEFVANGLKVSAEWNVGNFQTAAMTRQAIFKENLTGGAVALAQAGF